jgi:hypothetical protein
VRAARTLRANQPTHANERHNNVELCRLAPPQNRLRGIDQGVICGLDLTSGFYPLFYWWSRSSFRLFRAFCMGQFKVRTPKQPGLGKVQGSAFKFSTRKDRIFPSDATNSNANGLIGMLSPRVAFLEMLKLQHRNNLTSASRWVKRLLKRNSQLPTQSFKKFPTSV